MDRDRRYRRLHVCRHMGCHRIRAGLPLPPQAGSTEVTRSASLRGRYRGAHSYPLSRTRKTTLLVAGLRAGASSVRGAALVVAVVALVAIGIGPRTGKYRTLTVLSGSMAPGIPVGALVIDVPEPAGQIRVGQVLTYQIPLLDHRVVSHRVVKVISDGPQPEVQTKGDANNSPDPWTAVITSPVAWRVWAVVPHAGQWIVDLRQPVVHKALVLGLPGLLTLMMLIQIWRGPHREQGSRRAPAVA